MAAAIIDVIGDAGLNLLDQHGKDRDASVLRLSSFVTSCAMQWQPQKNRLRTVKFVYSNETQRKTAEKICSRGHNCKLPENMNVMAEKNEGNLFKRINLKYNLLILISYRHKCFYKMSLLSVLLVHTGPNMIRGKHKKRS